ncbi:MAG: hypothetical protein ACI37U_01510 [Bacteroides sp.]
MEKEIRKTVSLTCGLYGAFWLLPILLVGMGECGEYWIGVYADDASAVYWAETLTILLTAVCVPASLKLFSWVLDKQMSKASIARALHLYAVWSGLRLLLLAMPLVSGLLTYYLMWSGKGILCAMIALTASLFCLPGERRLRHELCIEQGGEEE